MFKKLYYLQQSPLHLKDPDLKRAVEPAVNNELGFSPCVKRLAEVAVRNGLVVLGGARVQKESRVDFGGRLGQRTDRTLSCAAEGVVVSEAAQVVITYLVT